MKIFSFLLVIILLTTIVFSQNNQIRNQREILNNSKSDFFIENKGQWSSQVRYLARLIGLNAWITDSGVVYDYFQINKDTTYSNKRESSLSGNDKSRIRGQVIRMTFQNCQIPDNSKPNDNSSVLIEPIDNDIHKSIYNGNDKQEGYYNYFIGKDSSKWASYVGLYKEVYVKDIYKGIDVRYYYDFNNEGKIGLRYDLVVNPGADLRDVRIKFDGADNIFINNVGELIIQTSIGEIRHEKLFTYQIKEEINNLNNLSKELRTTKIREKISEVECRFILNDDGTVSFKALNYDSSKTLIIDPLIWSTYIGGSNNDEGTCMSLDDAGNVYIGGYVTSNDYPTTTGSYDNSFNGGSVDIGITKFNSNGSSLVYSTYIGGTGYDVVGDIDVDPNGNLYLIGRYNSNDYPVTSGSYDETFNGSWDFIVTKLNSTGSALVYSTYIGGSSDDEGFSISTDASGNAYLFGYTFSNDFPIITGAYDNSYNGVYDLAVCKLNPSGNSLIYSTFIGGSTTDFPSKIVRDINDNVYLTGYTESNDYPVTGSAYDNSYNGGKDIFITKLNSTGSNLLFSTFMGANSDDIANSIKEEDNGETIITGTTASNNFPTTSGAYDRNYNGGSGDAFVTKFNMNGSSLIFSSYIGGNDVDVVRSLDLDNNDSIYISGTTSSGDFPITNRAFDISYNGSSDIFISKLNPNGTSLLYSSYIGGSNTDICSSILLDNNDFAYVSGYSNSSNFPSSSNAYDQTINGGEDIVLIKINMIPENSLSTGTISPLTLCQKALINVPYTISGTFNAGNKFTAQLSNALGSFNSPTDIGELVSTTSGTIPAEIPNVQPGTLYRIRVVSSNPVVIGTDNGSNITINAKPDAIITLGDTNVCRNNFVKYKSNTQAGIIYQWSVNGGAIQGQSNLDSVLVLWGNPGIGEVKLIQTNSSGCSDTTEKIITINPLPQPQITTSDTILCQNQTGLYNSNQQAGILYQWKVIRGIIIGASDTPTLTVRWDTAGTGLVRLIQTYAATGCKDSVEVAVVISPLPQPQITTSDTVLCINSTGNYSTDIDVLLNYQWFATGGIIQGAGNTASVSVLWNTEGTNKIKLIETYPNTGCKDSIEMNIIVNPHPTTQIIGNDFVVQNSTEQYSAENSPPEIDNLWSVNYGKIQGDSTNSVLNVKWDSIGTGRIILRQTNTNTKCINYDTMLVMITESIPPLIVNAGTDKEFCKGGSTQIGSVNAASGGVQPYRYIWTPSLGLSNDTIPNPIASPLQSTVYSLTVYDSRDSTATDNVTVSVNPLPLPQIAGKNIVLKDSTETYLANTPAGTTNFWSQEGGTSSSNPNGNSYDVKWDMQGSGKVILMQTITATGCSASDTLDITIGTSIPELSVEAGTNKSICEGESIQIGSANPASGGEPPHRFLWTPSQGLSNDTIPNPTASPLQSTVYSLTVLDVRDSIASDSVLVTVNPLPKPLIRGNTNVQRGKPITYSSDTTTGTVNSWSVVNGSGEPDNTKSTFQITWNNLGTGNVILKQTISQTGCTDSDTIIVNILATIPPLISDAGPDKSVCKGDTVQIGNINAGSGGVEPYKYKWSPSVGLNNDTIPNPLAYPIQSTVYSLSVFDSQDSVSGDVVNVTINPLPIPQINGKDSAMRGSTITYTVGTQAGVKNEWTVDNGTQIGSGKGNTFQVRWDSAGTGKVIVEQTNFATGCHASDTLIVTIDAQQYAAMLGLPDMEAEPGQEIYMPIYLRDAELLANTNVKSIFADLIYNSSLLLPIETTPVGSLSNDGKERIIPLRLAVTPPSDSTLQHLSFIAMLGNDSTTVLRFENILPFGANVNIGAYPGRFTLKGICREGGVRLITSGPKTSIVINPNPVSNTANIDYQTFKGYAKLYIVNSFGEIVNILVGGEQSAGWHTAIYDLTNVPSGVYFVILQSQTKWKAVRMDILK